MTIGNVKVLLTDYKRWLSDDVCGGDSFSWIQHAKFIILSMVVILLGWWLGD